MTKEKITFIMKMARLLVKNKPDAIEKTFLLLSTDEEKAMN